MRTKHLFAIEDKLDESAPGKRKIQKKQEIKDDVQQMTDKKTRQELMNMNELF